MENKQTWWTQKEISNSKNGLDFTFFLIKTCPLFILNIIINIVSFFYFLFSPKTRRLSYKYQEKLSKNCHFKISPYNQIRAFSFSLVEKLMAWKGRAFYKEFHFNGDYTELNNSLNEGKGLILMGSHLGNIELLRNYCTLNFNKDIPVAVIMDINLNENFINTIKKINPLAIKDIISPESIGPDTICYLKEILDKGGLVVYTGDRISKTGTSNLRLNFLNSEADFPYGVFLMTCLLDAPLYYIFAMREKNFKLGKAYNIYIEKSKINLQCSRKERESRILSLGNEYVKKLEKYCSLYPYQWYNFFDFWKI